MKLNENEGYKVKIRTESRDLEMLTFEISTVNGSCKISDNESTSTFSHIE